MAAVASRSYAPKPLSNLRAGTNRDKPYVKIHIGWPMCLSPIFQLFDRVFKAPASKNRAIMWRVHFFGESAYNNRLVGVINTSVSRSETSGLRVVPSTRLFRARNDFEQIKRDTRTMLNVDQIDSKPVLTTREHEILELVAIGLSAKEVALEISIAPRTVERHIENIRLKMRARNRTHMVTCAAMSGLLQAYSGSDIGADRPDRDVDARPPAFAFGAQHQSPVLAALTSGLRAANIVVGGQDGVFLRRLA
jgi:LuxR family transcriptional regulator, transcriptional regulator of spore coat protein